MSLAVHTKHLFEKETGKDPVSDAVSVNTNIHC